MTPSTVSPKLSATQAIPLLTKAITDGEWYATYPDASDDALFQDASLGSANLRGAVLIAADFTGASLRAADIEGADLSKSRLINVDLSAVRVLRIAKSQSSPPRLL